MDAYTTTELRPQAPHQNGGHTVSALPLQGRSRCGVRVSDYSAPGILPRQVPGASAFREVR